MPEISRRSFYYHLKVAAISKRKKQKWTHLTPELAAVRLQWCLDHQHYTREDWAKVWWSDECSIERSSGNRPQWVFRTPEDKWLPHAVQTYSQSNRVTVMVWGAFNGHGCSELVICTGDPEAARGGVSS